MGRTTACPGVCLTARDGIATGRCSPLPVGSAGISGGAIRVIETHGCAAHETVTLGSSSTVPRIVALVVAMDSTESSAANLDGAGTDGVLVGGVGGVAVAAVAAMAIVAKGGNYCSAGNYIEVVTARVMGVMTCSGSTATW